MRSFEDAVAENTFWEQQTQKSAADEFYNSVFDTAFEAHTAKLAALDPEYAAILHVEQQKMAFDQAYYATLAQHGMR